MVTRPASKAVLCRLIDGHTFSTKSQTLVNHWLKASGFESFTLILLACATPHYICESYSHTIVYLVQFVGTSTSNNALINMFWRVEYSTGKD